jgi:transposase
LWGSYGLANYELGAGALSVKAVGIDLGRRDLRVSSEGPQVPAEQFYRDLEPALARSLASTLSRIAMHAKASGFDCKLLTQ